MISYCFSSYGQRNDYGFLLRLNVDMDDEKKLKITRSQLLDDARKLSRVQMVSDRIYRNHLKTRFFNLQEQRKLTNTIDELEKQEKDSWRELNHRKLGLERRANKLAQKKAINRVAASPLITLRTAGRAAPPKYNGQDPPPRNGGRREGRTHLAAPKIWGQERRPSFSSLMNPYMTDPTEYGSKLGYAQHLTKKGYRKSSTMGANLELEDLQQYYYNQPQFSKSQAVIFRGLKQSAEGLMKMGVIQSDGDARYSRRISGLPIPATIEEDQARYIRTPGQIDEDPLEEEMAWLPTVTLEHSVSYPGERRRSSISSDPNFLRTGGPNRLSYRRGSRSLGALEMKKFLPYAGRCPSPVSGLDSDFSDKLSLFNQRMDQLQQRDGVEVLPDPLLDDHAAPPPRDSLDRHGSVSMDTSRDEDKLPIVLAGRSDPVRMSVVDRFDLSKWRRDMAVQDTLPVIKSCKYIRNPSRERYDPSSNQYYVIDEEGGIEGDIPAPLPNIPGTRLYNVVQEAIKYSREVDQL